MRRILIVSATLLSVFSTTTFADDSPFGSNVIVVDPSMSVSDIQNNRSFAL